MQLNNHFAMFRSCEFIVGKLLELFISLGKQKHLTGHKKIMYIQIDEKGNKRFGFSITSNGVKCMRLNFFHVIGNE